jgi:hypothetical protein
VVLINLVVSSLDDLIRRLIDVVRKSTLEFITVLFNLLSEVAHFFLDVLRFFLLDGENLSFNGSKGFLSGIAQVSLDVLKDDQEVLLGLHGNSMLLEEHDSLLHGFNTSKSVIGDHLNITEVLHDLHEVELLFFSLGSFGEVLNSRRHVLHEIANVVDFRGSVLEEVLGVLLNPLLNSAVECVNEGLRADLQPSNVMDELLSINVVLNGV